ncbi:MAG: fructose-bisphosphatase class II, partial [bacterium]
ARIKLIEAGDVAPAVATGFPESGIDVVMGIGGAPEGVLAAAALRCVGGEMQARLHPTTDEEIKRASKMMGTDDVTKVLYMDDLVKGKDVIFAATGITDGDLLSGVRYDAKSAKTTTLVMRGKTGTIRFIEATHAWVKQGI